MIPWPPSPARQRQRANELDGTNLADQIFGLGGNDILIGFDGDDVLEGGAGADELFGSDGFDYRELSRLGRGRRRLPATSAIATGGDAAG